LGPHGAVEADGVVPTVWPDVLGCVPPAGVDEPPEVPPGAVVAVVPARVVVVVPDALTSEPEL
jgi:hypothetical protein